MSLPGIADSGGAEPTRPALPLLTRTMDFDLAAGLVLTYLRTHVPFALWSVTRVENGRHTFLYLDEANGYQLPQGYSYPWKDSLCIHMASGQAPTVAADVPADPLYAAAGLNATTSIGTIGAYAGAAIHEPNGNVFGTICGLDPERRTDDPALAQAAALLPLLGHLLTMVLAADRIRDHAGQSLLEASLTADTDALTSLHNRRAWDRMVLEEQQRFLRFAAPTVVLMVDLDQLKHVNDSRGHAAGDLVIQSAGRALRSVLRESDAVARVGGDEFAALLRGCTEAQAGRAAVRIHAALDEVGAPGSVGWAPVRVGEDVAGAVAEADTAMYVEKSRRRQLQRRREGWSG